MKLDTLQKVPTTSKDVIELAISDWLKAVFIAIVVLLVICLAVVYLIKKKIYVKVYSKLLIIMDKLEKNYELATRLFNKGDYEMAIVIIEDINRVPRLTDELKKKCANLKIEIQHARDKQFVEDLLCKINNLLTSLKFKEAKELLLSNKPRNKSDYDMINNQIINAEVDNIKKTVDRLIKESKVKEAYSYFNNTFTEFSEPKFLKDVDEYLRSYIQNELPKLLEKNEIESLEDILRTIEDIIQYRSLPQISDLKTKAKEKLYNKVFSSITEALEKYEITEAQQILDKYRNILLSTQIATLNRKISEVRNSKPYIAQELRKKVVSLANDGKFKSVYTLIENAEKSYKENFNTLRQEIQEIEETQKLEVAKQRISTMVAQIHKKINSYDLNNIDKDLAELRTVIESNEKLGTFFVEELGKLNSSYGLAKSNINKEHTFYGSYPLAPIGIFNVEKKTNAGEDADPILEVQADRNWGVLGVFDGMGGAGARRYIHNTTMEEHTSAYWASRFVRNAVDELIKSRPIGTDPIEYLENNLHHSIKKKLDCEIQNFPATSSTSVSKSLAKLPTTMALCAYQIVYDSIMINCYWAGDSRVYLFDGDRLCFLTLDDADAPAGDPFSPANMDLAMNNKICQDQEYRINKSTIKVKMIHEKPIILFAATDGCFGYYKNPIEFENMILSVMSSSQIKEWMPKIKQAIIDNIQQDDFSMSAVLIGSKDCDSLQSNVRHRLSENIFADYLLWRNNEQEEQNIIRTQIDECGPKIENKLIELNKVRNAIEEIINSITKFKLEFEASRKTLLKYSSKSNISIEENSLYNKLNELHLELQTKEVNLNKDITNLQEYRNGLKDKLEDLQLQAQRDNNEWYTKYKSIIKVIQPSQQI